jgi:uncharacterized membrane protein YeaQ/YmgE (transglycosylase-associated protein family)
MPSNRFRQHSRYLGECARSPALKRGGEKWASFGILIGFIAGVIAKLVTPGKNEPQGFILTTVLGIVGAFVATYLGQAVGRYQAGEGAGLIGAIVGAVICSSFGASSLGAARLSPDKATGCSGGGYDGSGPKCFLESRCSQAIDEGELKPV